MKRLTLVLLFVLSPLPAAAQIPVTDIANFTQQILQYAQMGLEYERQLEELTEARNQVGAITGNYSHGELLNGGAERDDRRYTPTTWRDTLRILEAGGLPGSVADVRRIVGEHTASFAIIGADDYNQLNPNAPNAKAFQQRRDTNLVTMAIAETSFGSTQTRMAHYETFMGQIEAADNVKSIADLSARIAAENGTSLAELIRLQSVQLQQAGVIEAQQLVDETNMKRQTRYQDFAFGELPTE
ncbi:MAG: hypothetical protein HQ492_02185 [Woeseiaceae bacterium]|nr:hypothetical protein [Woeseiaceae bacterium]